MQIEASLKPYTRPDGSYDTALIRELLKVSFNDEELEAFCFDHFPEVQENFAGGLAKGVKIQMLLDFCKRQKKYYELLVLLHNENPTQFEVVWNKRSSKEHIHKIYTQYGVGRISITVSGDLSDATPEQKQHVARAIVGVTAAILSVSPEQIHMLGIDMGSIVLDLLLPQEAIERLKTLYERKDSELRYLGLLELSELDAQDLTGLNLSRANLSRANLSRIILREATLEGSNLEGVNLQEVTLEESNLEGANLKDANLKGANLLGAKLERANLQGANLQGADLRGAGLSGAKLERANLQGANLFLADLRGADLAGADLQGAKLQGAKLQGAKLQGAKLQGAKLQGANLEGANLEGADLTGVNLEDAILRGTGPRRSEPL